MIISPTWQSSLQIPVQIVPYLFLFVQWTIEWRGMGKEERPSIKLSFDGTFFDLIYESY